MTNSRFDWRLKAVRFRASIIALILLVSSFSAQAQILWDLNFTDAVGVGFNDASLGSTRQAALRDSLNTIGRYLGHSATVSLDISSVNNSSENFLAYAGSDGYGFSGNPFTKTVVQKKIQTNGATDYNGSSSDGLIVVNFAYDFSYNNTIGTNQFDFKGIMMHEFTHTLGFLSYISPNGSSYDTTNHFYSQFDSFLTDVSGNSLINPSNGVFDSSKVPLLTSDGVYFKSPTTGQKYPIYSPSVFAEGSSLSHLDDPNAMMYYAVAPETLMLKGWNPAEKDILSSLGYTVIPENSTIVMTFAGILMIGYCLRRNRHSVA